MLSIGTNSTGAASRPRKFWAGATSAADAKVMTTAKIKEMMVENFMIDFCRWYVRDVFENYEHTNSNENEFYISSNFTLLANNFYDSATSLCSTNENDSRILL